MGLIRSFSDESKSQLETAIGYAEQDIEGYWYFNDLWDWITDAFIDVSIDDSADDYRSYYNSLADKYDMSLVDLNRVFDNVYDIETQFCTNLSTVLDQAQDLSQAMSKMASLIDPWAAGGIPLALPSFRFNDLLDTVTLELYRKLLERVVSYDENDVPTYDWEEIDAILNKDVKYISELEFLVLAQLYSGMSLSDTEKFLKFLADKRQDVHIPGYAEIFGPQHAQNDYTEWEYNLDKIDGIQKYVDAFQCSIAAQQWVIDHVGTENVEVLYTRCFPDGDQSIDVDSKRQILITSLNEQRLAIAQQSAFLSIVEGLVDQPSAGEQGYGIGMFYYENGPLTGEAGAQGPSITLTQEGSGDITLTFCNTLDMSISTDFASVNTINHLNSNTLSISPAATGEGVSANAMQNAEAYYTAKYTFDFTDTAVENTSEFVRDQITSNMLEAAVKKSTSRLIGLIPFAGDFTSFVIDTGMDYHEERLEAEQNMNDARASLNAWSTGSYCSELKLTAVIVNDGSATQQFILYPSADTPNVVQNINELIQRRDAAGSSINLAEYNLTYPITMKDVMNNIGSVNDLLENGMTESEREYVTNPRH
jgi:hypothetical protein